MTLFQLIQARKAITFEQQFGLITLLTFHLLAEDRENMRILVTNRLYSTFEDMEFSKRINILLEGAEFKPILERNRTRELKAIQKYLLSL